jgi:hypothetical protein
VLLAGVLAIAVPLLLEDGLDGFGLGFALATAIAVLVRFGYLRRLFPLRRVTADLARALLPTVPAIAAVLLLRLGEGGDSAARALLELGVFALVVVGVTLVWERRLLREAVALLRRPPVPQSG